MIEQKEKRCVLRTLMPRNIFLCNETKDRKRKKKAAACVQTSILRGTPRQQRIICMSCEGNFLQFFSPLTQTSWVLRINILCNMKFQGEKIVQFLFRLCFASSPAAWWKYVDTFFYEKEVVLRAYVYSSDFINGRDNWSEHTPEIGAAEKNAWDCNFYNIAYNEMKCWTHETFYLEKFLSSVEDEIRDVETLIAQPQHGTIWGNLIFNAQDRLISISSNHFFNYEYFPFPSAGPPRSDKVALILHKSWSIASQKENQKELAYKFGFASSIEPRNISGC